MSTSNAKRHDKQAIKEFLIHAAGELRLQELALAGKAVPPNIQNGVTQFRAKYGVELLPNADLLCFLANDPDGEGDQQRDAARQALVQRRHDQLKQVASVIELLGEMEL